MLSVVRPDCIGPKDNRQPAKTGGGKETGTWQSGENSSTSAIQTHSHEGLLN